MKLRRFVTWPFAVFLMFYGLPSNDPTVVTAVDMVLFSALLGAFWAVVVGIPLAALFRKGDLPLTRGTFLGMGVALAATIVMDLQGWGMLGAAGYIFWLRGPVIRPQVSQPAPPKIAD